MSARLKIIIPAAQCQRAWPVGEVEFMAAFLSMRSSAPGGPRARQRREGVRTRLAAALGCLLLAISCVSATIAAPTYEIATLGFTDAEHTRNDGYQASGPNQLNDLGQVIGVANRYQGGSIDLGRSAWIYNGVATINIGLTSAEHTRNDGYKYGIATDLFESGRVLGYSNRYNGGPSSLGQSIWLYNGASTIDIGLTDAAHTRADGYKRSVVGRQNKAGQVAGISERFDGAPAAGRSAWLFDGATTINIGLTDSEHNALSDVALLNEAGQVLGSTGRIGGGTTLWLYEGTSTIDVGLHDVEHTRADGYRDSFGPRLNEAGWVSGHSNRYNGGTTHLGYSAWLRAGGTTTQIGFTGPEYTRLDGYKHSAALLLEAGHVVGYSERFNGSASLGDRAWLYDGAMTREIGLTGPEHTRDDGYKQVRASKTTSSGKVVGSAHRFNGGSGGLGWSVWLYDGATTIELGLTGPEHTRSDGYRESEIGLGDYLNESGQAIGYSKRYDGFTDWGQDVWLYDGSTTKQLGLTGPEHTSDDGYKYSRFGFDDGSEKLNESGQTIGWSHRYEGGSTFLGRSAWLYDGATTVEMGLTGADTIRSDGYKYSIAEDLNENGQVVGYTQRFASTAGGQDAWLYDPALDETFALQLSARSDGYAHSQVEYLGEDGLVLGYYNLFGAQNADLGKRAFYFTTADGLHDLGELVDDGLANNDWDYLADRVRANSSGQIIGRGKLASQAGGAMAYLLTPIISSPGDFNGDGTVDAVDYTVWRDHLGSSYDLGGNGDESGASAGIVDTADYDLWKTNFGQSSGGGSSVRHANSSTSVPEPGWPCLVVLSFMGFLARRTHTGTPTPFARNHTAL